MKTIGELRTEMLELKKTPCVDCGRSFPLECMDFDHVPERGEKVGSVGSLLNDEIAFRAEIAKCDVICANCHRIRTRKRGPSTKARQRMSVGVRAALSNPEVRAKMSARAFAVQNDPETKARQAAARQRISDDPERRALISSRRSAAAKEAHARPEVNAKLRQSTKLAQNRPEVRAKQAVRRAEVQSRPEVLARKSEANRIRHVRNRLRKLIRTFDRKAWMQMVLG